MTTENCDRQVARQTRALASPDCYTLNIGALENPLFEWIPTRRYCLVGSRLLKGQMREPWQKTFPERPDRQRVL